MNRILYYLSSLFLLLVLVSISFAEDYRWIITYPTVTNPWGRKMASGENKTVMKLQFIDMDPTDDYKLTNFAIRPTTDRSEWYIDTLQLWVNKDDYPGSLDRELDSLMDSGALSIAPAQSEPDAYHTFYLGDGQYGEYILDDTTTFFVTAVVHDWRDDVPINQEIDDQNGARFGITLIKEDNDLEVATLGNNYSKTSNNWRGNETKYFEIRAVNLPIKITDINRKDDEDASIFYPNYLTLDTLVAGPETIAESKSQIITDLTFTADVYLPHSANNNDSLSYASFKVVWDSRILQLELDSIDFGDIWEGKQLQGGNWDGSGFGVTKLPGDTNYYEVRFEGIVLFEPGGSLSGNPHCVDIANNSLAKLKFKVVHPGISPIYLSDIVIMDQWGIPYHTYRTLRNDSNGEYPSGKNKYDAWAKFILGDFGPESDGLKSGECDGMVTWKDITIFADYIWMDTSSSDWYSRFDIGSPGYHNPDELSPDDTTNFFDLIVLGTNYHRTLKGSFSQKIVQSVDKELEVSLSAFDSSDDYIMFVANLSLYNALNIMSVQAKIKYDPNILEFLEVTAGDWVNNISSKHVLLFPKESIKNGIVDINFLALDHPLIGDGKFATIIFKKKSYGNTSIILDYFDPRDINSNKVEYNITVDSKDLKIPKDFILLTNYPNPFNPGTQVSYNIPEGMEGLYHLRIYDVLGRQVRTLVKGYHKPEEYMVFWDGKNDDNIPVVSGVYFIQLSGQGSAKTKKIMLLR